MTDQIREMLVILDHDPEDQALQEQLAIFVQALGVYAQRNAHYKDNFVRMGWRGQLIRVRERAERLWDAFWDAPALLETGADSIKRDELLDDAYDLINFAAFLIRLVRSGNRDGTWFR